MTYCDDNYGVWNMEGEDDLTFYNQVQAESIWKRCQGCGGIKKLRPDYGLCNTCATMLEHGGDLDPPDKAFLDPKVDLELQLLIAHEKVEQEIRRRKQIAKEDDVAGEAADIVAESGILDEWEEE